MKKLIAAACVAIASAVALASTVQSSNTFGVLKVATGNTSNEKKQYFISVPWEAVGGGYIKPDSLVLASNLSAGDNDTAADRLYVYTGAGTAVSFGVWKVVENGGVKSWEADSSTDVGNGLTTSPGNETTTVPRGTGMLIETAAKEIYLSGQYASGNNAITIASSSNGKTPAYTLLGADLANSYNLNEQNWTNPRVGDLILLNGGTIYSWTGDTKWLSSQTDEPPILVAGTGAWYIRLGTEEASVQFTTTYVSSN